MSSNFEELPLVTVYGVSVLPYILNPLIVTVRASVSALEYAASKGLPVFVAGEINQTDVNSQPDMNNLYPTGTICSVEMNQSIRLPDGSLRIVLMGLSRAKIESLENILLFLPLGFFLSRFNKLRFTNFLLISYVCKKLLLEEL